MVELVVVGSFSRPITPSYSGHKVLVQLLFSFLLQLLLLIPSRHLKSHNPQSPSNGNLEPHHKSRHHRRTCFQPTLSLAKEAPANRPNAHPQAGGNCGRFITEALLKTGKHTVTALTRHDSSSKLPEGVLVKQVDYENSETVVEALRGQEALVMTLGGFTSQETVELIIRAAGEAGVKWLLPNEWSPDSAHEGLVKDVFIFQSKGEWPCG